MKREREVVISYISLGGGVQSGTLVEMAVNGDIDKPDMVIFADTGDEPQYVYDYVEYLRVRSEEAGMEFYTVSSRNLADDIMSGETHGGSRFIPIPVFGVKNGKKSIMRRQCTNHYKIKPIEKLCREVLLARGFATRASDGRIFVKRSVAAEVLIGISIDEYQRMKTSRTTFVRNKYPLVEKRMSRDDCISYLGERDLPIPGKSSCRFCPYHGLDYFAKMKQSHPDDFDYVVDIDRSLRDERKDRFSADGDFYLSSKYIPLEDAVANYERSGGAEDGNDGEFCEGGYCFV